MEIEQRIDQAAQQCVKCGLCLPYCPTYVVAKNENESARGRIALMQGAVHAQVPITEKLTYHLDTCLACRACEAVCPAGVQYEELITTTRTWLNAKQKPSRLEHMLIFFMEHPRWRKILAKILVVYKKSELLQRIGKKLQNLPVFSLLAYTPTKNFSEPCHLEKPVSINAAKRKTALLLAPCASTVMDQRTINDAKKIIEYLGWELVEPKEDYCCGALSLHAGELTQAQHCASQQIKQWNDLKPDIILSLASGCHSILQEYEKAPLNMETPKILLQTIEEFLLEQIVERKLNLTPSAQHVVIHTPCTLRNAIRKPNLILQLLQQIPELTCIPVPSSMGCCGAAGSYFLRHHDIAQKLVSPIVEFMREQKVNLWVTSNIGCSLHIQHALTAAELNIQVLHPISLIAQQLVPLDHILQLS